MNHPTNCPVNEGRISYDPTSHKIQITVTILRATCPTCKPTFNNVDAGHHLNSNK